MKARSVVSLPLLLLLSASLFAGDGKLTDSDLDKIRQVHTRYEQMWLQGNSDGIRSLFVKDSVLLPPHSGKPRLGRKGMDEFWFPPDSPPTKVTKLVLELKSIGGDGQIAYVWGTDEVAWIIEEDGKEHVSSHQGTFLNVLQKQSNGEWKISHHMWDDVLPDRR